MSAGRGDRLGVLLASGAAADALASCGRAVEEGRDAYLYLIHEGTRRVHDAGVQSLRMRGMRLFCCAYGARRRGMETDDAAVYCGLGTLADILAAVDRFESFTGVGCGSAVGRGSCAAGGGKRGVRVAVCSDPAADDRAAEGVRVAAGLLASGVLQVSLAFVGDGRRCLAPGAEALVDGRELVMHLGTFRDLGGRVWEGEESDLDRCFAVMAF